MPKKVYVITSSCICDNNDHINCEAIETERIRNILTKKGYSPKLQFQQGIEQKIIWVKENDKHFVLKKVIEIHVLGLEELNDEVCVKMLA